MGDFELAARNSLQATFEEADFAGCQFHFAKAIIKKLWKIGLSRQYKNNTAMKRNVRKILVLPYLPPDQIRGAAEQLFAEDLGLTLSEKRVYKKFINYFKKYWLGIVGAENLSVYNHAHGTNNSAESLHAGLKRHIRSHNPNVWTFLGHLNDIVADETSDLLRLENGMRITRPQKEVYKQNSERREMLKRDLEAGRSSVLSYLSAMSHTFNTALCLSGADVDDDEGEEEEEEDSDQEEEQTNQGRPRCPVCLGDMDSQFATIPCGHVYCDTCSRAIVQQCRCAVCRQNVTGRLQTFVSA